MAFSVTAYLSHNVTHDFPAADLNHAREIAKRIITEGLWVILPDQSEVFYPVHLVFKVRIDNVPHAS